MSLVITFDPYGEKYYDLSPYAFCNNNPVNFVDPDGMDWYEDDAGNAKWIDFSTEVHVDSTGREWKNIGPEYLFFNGQYLFTSNNLSFISMKLYLEVNKYCPLKNKYSGPMFFHSLPVEST